MRMGAVAALTLLGGALLMPAQSASAAHERTCRDAIDSGMFNLIKGSGVIYGTSGPDVIIGSAGNDTIYARGGDDVVCARGGDDLIDGGTGNYKLLGDRGDRDPDTGEAFLGQRTFGPAGSPGNDRIMGGSGNDTIYGDELRDPRLDGGSGNDSIFGGGGSDELLGGSDNDKLEGDSPAGNAGNADVCRGGSGTDTANNCETTTNVP